MKTKTDKKSTAVKKVATKVKPKQKKVITSKPKTSTVTKPKGKVVTKKPTTKKVAQVKVPEPKQVVSGIAESRDEYVSDTNLWGK